MTPKKKGLGRGLEVLLGLDDSGPAGEGEAGTELRQIAIGDIQPGRYQPRTGMSVLGSLMTLSYFSLSAKADSVGVLQNVFPTFTALYSLYLDIKHRGWDKRRDISQAG